MGDDYDVLGFNTLLEAEQRREDAEQTHQDAIKRLEAERAGRPAYAEEDLNVWLQAATVQAGPIAVAAAIRQVDTANANELEIAEPAIASSSREQYWGRALGLLGDAVNLERTEFTDELASTEGPGSFEYNDREVAYTVQGLVLPTTYQSKMATLALRDTELPSSERDYRSFNNTPVVRYALRIYEEATVDTHARLSDGLRKYGAFWADDIARIKLGAMQAGELQARDAREALREAKKYNYNDTLKPTWARIVDPASTALAGVRITYGFSKTAAREVKSITIPHPDLAVLSAESAQQVAKKSGVGRKVAGLLRRRQPTVREAVMLAQPHGDKLPWYQGLPYVDFESPAGQAFLAHPAIVAQQSQEATAALGSMRQTYEQAGELFARLDYAAARR